MIASNEISLTSKRAACGRCEVLPSRLTGPGTLHLHFPLSHSRSKLLNLLKEQSQSWEEQDTVLSLHVPHHDLGPLTESLMNALSSVEQADVRVIFQRNGQTLQLADYFEIDTLCNFAAKAQSGWLLDMMADNRLTSFFQPIVECQNPAHVFAYECLLRGEEVGAADNSAMVPPSRIFEVARGAGLLFAVDLAARRAAIRQASRHGIECKIFINFTPTAVYDPVNCLRSTVRAISELGLRPDQIVFEVIESELVADVGHLNRILDYYRASGFGVALDDLGSGYSGLNMLSRLRPDYIKLDRELTSDVVNDPFKAMIARKLLEAGQELGIATIAEGVESEEEVAWLREQGANYMQGYFIARPAAKPPLQHAQSTLSASSKAQTV